MDRDTLSKLVALTDIDGIGGARAYELYQHFGDIDQVLEAPRHRFDGFHYVTEQVHREFNELDERVAAYRARFEQYADTDIEIIGVDDDRYPGVLRAQHCPPVLYARGDVDLLERAAVSFSGSREVSDAGATWTRRTAAALADAGYVVVSGGALGVDTAAHRGALDAGGETVVVLGTGVNVPYPEANEALFEEVVEAGGLVVSHRWPDAEPSREGFLHRNKTNAALGAGIVIVATDGSGGTMAQYRDAVAQDRSVFVPDPGLGLEPTAGIEEIVADGDPVVVRAADEIVERLDGDGEQSSLGDWA